jgi:glycosyltransferase involved in cell wall biosynthesis
MSDKISVIITTHNRAKLLEYCLESLANQSISKSQYEIILVDNYSTDNGKSTSILSSNIIKKYPSINLNTIYQQKIGGMTYSRHLAIENSNGNIIVCADDDYVADYDLLKSVIECFKDKTVGAICGKLLPMYESTPPSWIKKITTFLPNEEYYITDFSVIDLGNKKKDVGWQYMFWSNWAIRKDIFDKMNGFGPDGFSGDYIFYNGSGEHFLNKELSKYGYRTVYTPGMSAWHNVLSYRFTQKYFEARYFHYGIVNSFERINAKERIDTFKEKFFYLLSLNFQMLKDLIKMPLFLKFRMFWVILGYIKHQRLAKINSFFLNYCKIKNYKKFDFSSLTPIQNKKPGLW